MAETVCYCVGRTYQAKDDIKALTWRDLGVGHRGSDWIFRWNAEDKRWEARVEDDLIDALCGLVSERCDGVSVECDTEVEARWTTPEEDEADVPF